jgi:hypothetical protein
MTNRQARFQARRMAGRHRAPQPNNPGKIKPIPHLPEDARMEALRHS